MTSPRYQSITGNGLRLLTSDDGGALVRLIAGDLAGFAGPTGLDVNAATNRVYVANNGAGTVSVVDGTTNSIVGTTAVGVGPRDVAVNAATNRVYVSNGGTAATPFLR